MKFSDLNLETLARMAEESPSTLLVMAYDQAIESLAAAADAAEAGDIEARFDATTDAAEIVSELRLALDIDNGGQVAVKLDALYAYIVGHLPMVNLNNDAGLARSLGGLLAPLRDSWAQLDEMIRNGAVEIEIEEHITAASAAAEATLAAAI